MTIVSSGIQFIIAAGLINVWIFRNSKATEYRGGEAKSLQEEFAAYGLPSWMYFLVGFLKLGSALLFIVGYWVPQLRLYPATIIMFLMAGAVLMHIKVKDPLKKALPATAMLLMSAFLVINSLPA